MSFAATTKKELTRIEAKKCCQRAELSALVRINGVIQIGHDMVLGVRTENAATARRIFLLFKEVYGLQPEVLVRKKVRLKKNRTYMIRLKVKVLDVLRDLGIIGDHLEQIQGIASKLLTTECCRRSYLRGAFLAGGSVNNPDSGSYHLELVSTYYDHGEALCHLMNRRYQLHAKMIERKKGFVTYIKEGDKIGEFLNIIGAHQSLFHFEDVRIMKDMRNSVNRLVNCDTANLNKTIQAAMRQIESIQIIEREQGLDQLPPPLREIAVTRLKYPEISLTELGQMLPSGKLSKSAVNHRMRKIHSLADKIRGYPKK